MQMRRCGYVHLAGIDIAANQDNCTRMSQLGIDVCCGDITRKGTWPGAVDCIRMEHVLEHVPDSKPLLDHLSGLLSPSGWLVLTVPDFDWWFSNRSQAGQVGLDLPLHLYHYTMNSLVRLMTGAGFTVAYMESIRAGHRFLLNLGDVRVQGIKTGRNADGQLSCDRQAHEQRNKGEHYITLCAQRTG